MCWSLEASAAMVVAGAAATGVAHRQGQPTAIWATLGYFTVMEALQVAGYMVVDRCGTAQNQAVTLLSYLHIVFQPLFINAFAMELVPAPVKQRVRVWVFGLCALSSAVMLAQIIPWPALGACIPGTPLCGQSYCTASGNWHIAWHIPYNGLMVPVDGMVGSQSGFPSYMATVFLLPLLYGAWRFVLLHAAAGPALAWALTSNPNEMPAVWCLFSIAILCISLSPLVRRSMTSRSWWGVPV
ncbi:DUF5765 domain-containing protein [Roseobacter sinensis]|uniref:DUF5765 domain-containing protein n=1 Tax=Roseobacter sinensis TaxID=2931391 RepID=A0ABT3BEA3_9RHOB|nr:DUF5765 domain-containing protein [Roseobacter sp. WL0113]MCV3271484.1 DUF5765 domain-containing protein [Roseobacter sp. WL0113]